MCTEKSTCRNRIFKWLGLGDSYGDLINLVTLTVKDKTIMTELSKERAKAHDKWSVIYPISVYLSVLSQIFITQKNDEDLLEYF
jgi:hypothetical protein